MSGLMCQSPDQGQVSRWRTSRVRLRLRVETTVFHATIPEIRTQSAGAGLQMASVAGGEHGPSPAWPDGRTVRVGPMRRWPRQVRMGRAELRAAWTGRRIVSGHRHRPAALIVLAAGLSAGVL